MDVVAHYTKTQCRRREQISSVIEVMTESNVVALSINLCPGVSVMVVSVYLPPLDEVDLLDRNKGKSFIIEGDFNVKSTLWGESTTCV